MNTDPLNFSPHGESVIDLSLMESEKERQIMLAWLESYENL